jgi:hypothetical protein
MWIIRSEKVTSFVGCCIAPPSLGVFSLNGANESIAERVATGVPTGPYVHRRRSQKSTL